MNDTPARPAVERMQPPQALWDTVVNPIMRRLLRSRFSGLVDSRLGLLQFQGRRSGRDYEIPIGVHRVEVLRVLTNSGWRVNFRGGHPLRLKFEGAWHEGTGTLTEDSDEVATFYADRISSTGWQKAGRQLGIRINVDRAPTHEELKEAVERVGLSVLHIELTGSR
jgi:hypothetical protein